MMSMLLPILILVVLAIVVVAFITIKKTITYVDKEYRGTAIISFIFPIVGLIIYAVNIGTNKKLARSCIAPVIASMIFRAIIFVIAVLIIVGIYFSTH